MEQYSFEKEKPVKLKFADLAPETWEALGKLPRTGWVSRGVKNPESVKEHTVSLIELAASLEGLSDAEKKGLSDMLEIHDWPEALHGDEVILTDDEEKRKSLKAAKFENEHQALATICGKLGMAGGGIMDLWLRYENSEDDAASFARQLDKYQAVEKALEYEKDQKIPLFKEFLDHSRKYISHPVLLKKIEQMEAEWRSFSYSSKSSKPFEIRPLPRTRK